MATESLPAGSPSPRLTHLGSGPLPAFCPDTNGAAGRDALPPDTYESVIARSRGRNERRLYAGRSLRYQEPVPPIPQRIAWLDLLRVLAAAAVVVLHVTAPLLALPIPPAAASLFMTAVAWAVPVFVMISGATNLGAGKEIPVRDFYRRRAVWLPRTAAWVLLFIGLRFTNEADFTLAGAMRDLWRGVPYFHLWFLFMLLGLYAVTPLLSRLNGRLRLTLGVFILAVAALITAMRHDALGILQHDAITLCLPFIGYYLLGSVLGSLPLTAGWRWLGSCLFLAGASLLLAASCYSGLPGIKAFTPPPDLLFYAFSHPVALLSIGFFLLMRGDLPGPLARLGVVLAPLTFGVFVIHPIFLRLITALPFSYAATVANAITVVSLLTLLLSLLATWALRQVSFLRPLVG